MTYFILSPPYRHCSAGIRVLYELQKWLIRSGLDAVVVNSPCSINPDDIAVYPEVIWGNPLKAKKVVRYILNVPGALGGPDFFLWSDIKVGYNYLCTPYTDGHMLQIPVIEPFFTDRKQPRRLDCVYWGKTVEPTNKTKSEWKQHPITEGATPIDRYNHFEYPHTRRDMADLLNRCQTLYTYDDMTALADEARLCGCEVKLIRGDEVMEYPHPLPDYRLFPAQLKEFIERTAWDISSVNAGA